MAKVTLYVGDYNHYEKQKAHDEALLEMQYKNQQREIKQKTETIERFKAKASKASMAQSMIKALDKVERIELPPKAPDINFNFPPIQQSGSVVLTIENVAPFIWCTSKYLKMFLLKFNVVKKVALVAANGVGKTTLFNLIAHKLPLQTVNYCWIQCH